LREQNVRRREEWESSATVELDSIGWRGDALASADTDAFSEIDDSHV